jgi:hypothetical protein
MAIWPEIPQPGFPSGASLAADEACELLGPTGDATRVRLVGFDSDAHTISLQTPQGRSAVAVRFEQFQRLDLVEPVRPLPLPDGAEAQRFRPELYCITYQSGRRTFGLTLGVVDQAQGVFLFEPIDEQAAVRRVFIPRESLKGFETGPQVQVLMLESAPGATPAPELPQDGRLAGSNAYRGDSMAAQPVRDVKDFPSVRPATTP